MNLAKLEIKNIVGFFIGLIILIIGSFIVIFDYPQIQYLENLESDSVHFLDEETKNIYERLKIEFSLGITFLIIGIGVSTFSFLKKSFR